MYEKKAFMPLLFIPFTYPSVSFHIQNRPMFESNETGSYAVIQSQIHPHVA